MDIRGHLTRLAGTGAAIAVGSALLVGAASTAEAGTQATYYQVRNANSATACLQVNISGDKGDLVLGRCDRSAKQVWTIVNGVFRNPASGHCLDGNGADVYTFTCNAGAYQRWTTSSGSPKYIRHTASGKYLSGNGVIGSEVVFQPSTATTSRWVITQV